MSTRPYIIKRKDTGEAVAMVDATSQAQGLRIYAEILFKTEAASGAEVLAAVKAGVPVVDPAAKAE